MADKEQDISDEGDGADWQPWAEASVAGQTNGHLELLSACVALPVVERHETAARQAGLTDRLRVIRGRREQLEAIILGVAPDEDE